MTTSSSRRRNPYRPGTAAHAQHRRAELRRRKALAEATAARAKTPEARRRAKRRASAAQRSLRAIETRTEFQAALEEHDRRSFEKLSIAQQQRLIAVARAYPDRVPADIPDPFADRPDQRVYHRSSIWRLYYASRAGIRAKAIT